MIPQKKANLRISNQIAKKKQKNFKISHKILAENIMSLSGNHFEGTLTNSRTELRLCGISPKIGKDITLVCLSQIVLRSLVHKEIIL